MELAEKILRVAKERRLDLKEIAAGAGIPYGTLCGYTKAGSKRIPSAPTGIALARALGVSAEWLFGQDAVWPPTPYAKSPPFAIHPWPPDGISWAEVRWVLLQYQIEKCRAILREAGARFPGDSLSIDKHLDANHPQLMERLRRAYRETLDVIEEAAQARRGSKDIAREGTRDTEGSLENRHSTITVEAAERAAQLAAFHFGPPDVETPDQAASADDLGRRPADGRPSKGT